MNKRTLATLTAGSALALAALHPAHAAAGNPFAATPLKAGYQVADAGKAGEASCGAAKKEAEMKTAKQAEASCGAAKKEAEMKAVKQQEASCGASKK